MNEYWEKISFDDAFEQISTSGKTVKTAGLPSEGRYPVIDQGQAHCAGFLDSPELVISSGSPIIIFGDHTRAVKWVAAPFIPGADGVKVLASRQPLDARFFYYQLRNLHLESKGYARHFSQVRDAAYCLPPLAEQKRIAQKLDALLAQVDTLKARIDAIPALLKRFRQSVLTAGMYGVLTKDWRESQKNDSTKSDTPLERSLTLATERARLWRGRGKYKSAITSKDVDASEFLSIPVSWHRGTLDEVTWSIKDGPHFSPKYVDDGIRFISGGNIRPGKVDLSTGKYISKELHDELSVRCKPEYLDILYTKGGTTGVAAVNRTKDEFNVWVHVAVLKPLPDTFINPFFLELALNSPECYEQSQRFTHGVGNQDLGLTRMIKIVLPVPPIGEQNEIVRRVEQLFAFADHLEAKVASAKQRIDTLTQSLLAKAFRGELVPQDPNDEPASVLLERIRAQRAAAPKVKRGRQSVSFRQ